MRLVSVLTLVLTFAVLTAVSASPSCLTKSEARRHWPNAHLWWHGTRHCWDNQRGRKRYRDPVFSKKVATATFTAPVPTVPSVPAVPRPMTFAPALDVRLRFLPWEQRIAGSF